jgi:hypothetical protein
MPNLPAGFQFSAKGTMLPQARFKLKTKKQSEKALIRKPFPGEGI